MFATGWAADGGTRIYTLKTGEAPDVPKRGKIYGFSRASRRRLTDKLMAVPWDSIAGTDKHAAAGCSALVTLTYGCEFPSDWKTSKKHLDVFRRNVDHAMPGRWSAIWRMEYQKRGAPHFHILMMFDHRVSIKALSAWVKMVWTRIVSGDDKNHALWGADVRPLYQNRCSNGRLLRYLIKYLGKTDDQQREGGRIWGAWHDIPQEIRTIVLFETEQAWVQFLRRIRRWGKRSHYLRSLKYATGLRLFGLGHRRLANLARRIEGLEVVAV